MPPLIALAAALAGITLTLIALIHVYWAFGGRAGVAYALPTHPEAGKPLFTPGPVATVAVAGLLALAAWILLAQGGWLPVFVSSYVNRLGALSLAGVFALRTVGDFRYVGLSKRVKLTRFARADTRYFTPLCALLAVAAIAAAMAG